MTQIHGYNFNHLHYFYVVAQLENVTQAARKLRTSQSSLSIQIKTLETKLGKKLFRRSGRNIELTETGRDVFQFCKRAFSSFDEMHDRLVKNKTSMGARLTVGVSVDLDRPFVADILNKIVRTYPKNERPLLRLMSLPGDRLWEGLRARELDFLLTDKIFIDYAVDILGESSLPVSAYASPAIVKEAGSSNLEEMMLGRKVAVVLPTRPAALRSEIDVFLAKKRWAPALSFESNVFSSVLRATEDGMGVAFAPSSYVDREVGARRLVAVSKKPLWRHRIVAVTRREGSDEPRLKFGAALKGEMTRLSG